MSATDSDNSIDWLASDDEDHESEREPDCTGRTSQTQGPDVAAPLPVSPRRRRGSSENGGRCCSSTEAKQGDGSWGEVSEASSRGSSSSCLETWDSDASGQCHAEQLPRSNGKSAAQALKRPHSAAPEQHKERPLNSNESEKDHLFTRKCVELQCYINPLSSILNGLRTGRYRQRLSSFQESVAMDRIQRIMGVLQKPCMGERYVNIILKMEEMLKSWFPNVKRDQHTVIQSEEAVPTKRLKLSAVTTTLTGAAAMPVTVGAPLPGAKTPRVTDLTPPGASSASNLKWLHTSPIRSPMAEQAQAGPRHLPPPRDRAKTQDNAVSSSTDSGAKTDSIPRGPPLCKISAPCLERLLKSTESIITHKGVGRGTTGRSWS